jgi:chemotaxis protein CheX
MQIAESKICQLTESIWNSMLGLDVEKSDSPVKLGEGYYSGTIQISGAWDGEVSLDCSAELARSLAALMFGGEAETAASDEIRDALGELTNMLGGNIKSLLPGPCQLSLPNVTEDLDHIDYQLRVQGGELLNEVGFYCEGGPLRITVVQRDPSAATTVATTERVAEAAVETTAKDERAEPAETKAKVGTPTPGTASKGEGAASAATKEAKGAKAEVGAPTAGGEFYSYPVPVTTPTANSAMLDLAAFIPAVGSAASADGTEVSVELPEEILAASRITQEGRTLLEEAKKEAERVLEEARSEADRLVSAARSEADRLVESSEIRLLAAEQAAAILAAAEHRAAEIRAGARNYAEEVLVSLEGCVTTILASIHKGREWLRSQ